MEPDKPAGQPALSSRLYSYGMTAPKSLVARRPGSAGQALDPLPGAERTGPSLRTRLPADAALSPSNALAASNPSNSLFGDTLASFASGGKQVGHSQPDPALSSGPLPFNQLARDRQRKAALIRDPPPGFVDRTDMAGPPVAAPADDAPERRRDPFWFIQMLRTELSDHEFAYMNVADTDGTTWDPYNLQIVAFADVNPLDHYTISAAGVTHCLRKVRPPPAPPPHLPAPLPPPLPPHLHPHLPPSPPPSSPQGKEEMMEFTGLEQWEKECGLFQQAMMIPFFDPYP